jgi:RNA polymerase sigma-70 factor (ECF subfamily)
LTIQDKVALGRGDYPSADEPSGERDRLLVEAHLRRDADAFAIIVDDHRDALVAQARRMLGPDGAAEDIVQETFERALKYLPRFGRSGEYRLGAWLSRILKSVVQNHWERKARELRSVQAEAAHVELEPDVAERVGDPVMAAALSRAVRALPDNQRAAFVMREVVGLPYADVAGELGITEDNARARVSRSKDHLRRTTANLRSAGAVVGLPFGLRALQARISHGWRAIHRGKSQMFGAGDRVATQLTASPVGQSALAIVSTGVPRGTLVFGIAATVATLSASTVVLTGSSAHATTAGENNTALVAAVQAPVVAAPTPAPATVSAPVAPALTPTSPSYSWVNPGNTSGAAAALPVATCVPTNGVTPPGAGFSSGQPLGLSNSIGVADSPAVDLSTNGPSMSFSSSAGVTPAESTTASSATVLSNVCLSSSGAWFTATVSGLGGTPVELAGTLQMVMGSAGDLGYVFRGTVTPSPASGPLAGAVQFVVDVTVLEPDNTAQLTIVFLSPTAGAVTSGNSAATQAAPSDADTTGTSDTSSAATSTSPSTPVTDGGAGDPAGTSGTPVSSGASDSTAAATTGSEWPPIPVAANTGRGAGKGLF